MGDNNQVLFVKKYQDKLEGPYLEIGSRDYGSTPDFRKMFQDRGDYLGVDMSMGKGVDKVVNFIEPFEKIDEALNGERFGTILCLSVLEHCENPFLMAENMTKLLREGGQAVISVPFAWQFHGYPSDYWRFSHEGVKKLFPELDFETEPRGASALSGAGFEPLDDSIGRLPFSFKENWKKGRHLQAVSSKSMKLLAKCGLLKWLAGRPYVMAPTMVSMIGVKNLQPHL